MPRKVGKQAKPLESVYVFYVRDHLFNLSFFFLGGGGLGVGLDGIITEIPKRGLNLIIALSTTHT